MTERRIRLTVLVITMFGFVTLGVVGVGGGEESPRSRVRVAAIPNVRAPMKENRRTSWPMFGGSASRNMVNTTDTLPAIPKKGPDWEKNEEVERWTRDWVLWKADLGSKCHTQPVVAGGKVFVGTNNDRPRNVRDTRMMNGELEPIDKGILMCFDERSGKFLWQAVFDKLESGPVNDWPHMGLCSSPTVDGDRLYFVSNRCTVVCADVNGLTDGRQGEVVREKYSDPTDADLYWEYDMRIELDVFPHNMSACSPLIVGDLVFICTSNGIDEKHMKLPNPDAPSFIALNKHTGKLIWKDNSPGKDILHGQWASPAYSAEPVPQVIFPGGDGWLRAFDPPTGKLLWKFDANPRDAVHELGGSGNKNDFIASPVISGGRLYIGVGQDPEHSDGIGKLWCIDLKKAVEGGTSNAIRDVSPELIERVEKQPEGPDKVGTKPNSESAAVWMFGGEEKRRWAVSKFKFGRTMSNTTVVGDILYIPDLTGHIHCLNARTGHHYWQYDTKSSIWGSCYYADGKVLVGTESGDLYVWRHVPNPETIETIDPNAADMKAARAFRKEKSKQIADKYLLAQIEFDKSIRTTPCVANGVLYVATEQTLYAFGKR